MARLFPFLAVLVLWFVVLSCSDETTTPPDTVSLSGVVRSGSSAEPMAGADIVALKSDNGAEVARTTSLSDGSFTLLNVPRVTVDLLVQKPGYLTQRLEDIDPVAELDPEGTGVNVRMIPDSGGCCSGVLTLTVKDQNAVGIPNVKVQLKLNGNLIMDPRTDSNGVVIITDLCPGAYSLRLSRDGYRVYEANFTINSTCDPVALTAVMETIQICCTGVMTLTVKTPQAVAIPGATVNLWKGGAIYRTGVTDANGVIVFDSLCTGSYGVGVSKQGYEARELTFSIGELCAPIEKFMVLESPACCDGIFTFTARDNSNNPVVGAKIVVKRNGVVKGEAVTNSNGTAVLDSLCEGEYTYRVSKDGWQVVEGNFAINSSCDPVTRDVVMTQNQQVCCDGIFNLLVKDSLGNPIQGAKVLVKKGGTAISDPVTNAEGKISLTGLCAGEYTWRVSKDGWQVSEGNFVINVNCDSVSQQTTLHQMPVVCCNGVLTLTVRDGNNAVVQGAKVYIKKGGAVIADPVTDANGQVVVSNLCAGSYSWKISKDGFDVNEGSFVINSNCDPVSPQATLTAICCTGVLTVTVVDSLNVPVPDATVKLWKNAVLLTTTLTNSSGVAVFTGLCKNSYGVGVTKTGYTPKEFQFSINASCDPFNKTVELIP